MCRFLGFTNQTFDNSANTVTIDSVVEQVTMGSEIDFPLLKGVN